MDGWPRATQGLSASDFSGLCHSADSAQDERVQPSAAMSNLSVRASDFSGFCYGASRDLDVTEPSGPFRVSEELKDSQSRTSPEPAPLPEKQDQWGRQTAGLRSEAGIAPDPSLLAILIFQIQELARVPYCVARHAALQNLTSLPAALVEVVGHSIGFLLKWQVPRPILCWPLAFSRSSSWLTRLTGLRGKLPCKTTATCKLPSACSVMAAQVPLSHCL